MRKTCPITAVSAGLAHLATMASIFEQLQAGDTALLELLIGQTREEIALVMKLLLEH